MIEERNVYWDYRNGHHTWRSKKFMDLTSESPPREISRVAYTKRGLRAKSPLWIFVKIGTEENQKIAAANIASTLCSVALASSKDLDILFNERTKSLILVLDCQYLINLFSYKVVDEKYANLVTIKNLIFNLFVETDIANQYEINEGNIIYFDFISVENFSPIKYRIEKIDIYNQQKFLDKLYSNIDCYMHQFKIIIDKISACHIFRDMKRYIIEYQGSENIRFASGLLQKTTKHLELPFLVTHLVKKNRSDKKLQDGMIKTKQNFNYRLNPILNWNCKKLCTNPCGLHHPLDVLAFNAKRHACHEQLDALAVNGKHHVDREQPETVFFRVPQKPEDISPRLSKVIDLCLDELPVFLFFAASLLGPKDLDVNGTNISIFFPFLYLDHGSHVIEKVLSLDKSFPSSIHFNNKQLTKHGLANLLKEQNSVNFIGVDDDGTDLLSILLKRSRTSNKDIYKIVQSISSTNDKKRYGRINCISFCTKETLIKFYRSKIFRSGIVKYLVPILPDINQHNFSINRIEELLYIFKSNITQIDECDKIFTKLCNEFNIKKSIFNRNFTGDLTTFTNYIRILFLLIVITQDENNYATLRGEKDRDHYEKVMLTANYLSCILEMHKNHSTPNFKFERLRQSLKKFVSMFKYKYIYERELVRPFLSSYKKSQIAKAIEMLCNDGIITKGEEKIPLKVGRKSSPIYEIMRSRRIRNSF